jgi:hypothetical protein
MNLSVEVRGYDIIVSQLGTSHCVTYRRDPELADAWGDLHNAMRSRFGNVAVSTPKRRHWAGFEANIHP